MKKITTLCVLVLSVLFINSIQAQKKSSYNIKPYGFVRTDYILDTRNVVNVREGQVSLFPLEESLDANNNDKNGALSSNILAITARLGLNFKGPDVWGAKISGRIEGDFFGNTERLKTESSTGSTGLFRLRHGYSKLKWANTSLLFGQTWNPSFVPEVSPSTSNFSGGAMFNPFGFVPQIRFEQAFLTNFKWVAIAYKDREFSSAVAEEGFVKNNASINSLVPMLNTQLKYKNKQVVAGVGAEYKSLKPLTVSNDLVSNETVNSMHFNAFFKYTNDAFVFKAYGVTGGNLYNSLMLSGYAGYRRADNGQEYYKPVNVSAAWLDVSSTNSKIAPGLFLGYTQINGVEQADFTALYVRGKVGNRMIDNVFRAAARVSFKQNNFSFVPELEFTSATYGDINEKAMAEGNLKNVNNFRLLLSARYAF